MIKLRKILLCDNLYRISIIIVILICLLITKCINYKSKYLEDETYFILTLLDYKIDGNKLSLTFKGKEKLVSTYYIETIEEKEYLLSNLKLGGSLIIDGSLEEPTNNTVPNLFNYKKYLYNNKIYYILKINGYKIDNSNINMFYKIKNYVYKKANSFKYKDYIYAFVLGKTSNIDSEVIDSYRTNGISHLFALSGLHVSIFSGILLFLLKKIKINELTRYILVFIFLLLFSFITGFSPSILRATLLFFLLGINKVFYFYIRTINILYLVCIILLLINPFYLYNLSFILSFNSAFFLILSSDLINSNNYYFGLLKVSLISFLANAGVSIYFFNYINPVSIILNTIFVPLVSIIIFPLSVISFLVTPLNSLLNILTSLMEKLSLFFANFDLIIYFPKTNLLIILLYYLFLIILIKRRKVIYFIFMLLLIVTIKIIPLLHSDTLVYFIDVGQGDSILIVTPHNKDAIMIDTGGKLEYETESWKKIKNNYSIANDKLIPFMRSIGINKLSYLFLTHGDEDHAGESLDLINNFSVQNIYINKGEINTLESKIANKKIIDFDSLQVDNVIIKSLNNKVFGEENDDSIVLLINIEGIKLLLMGDATKKTESELINNKVLEQVNILKVGHHGSNTSTSLDFINIISPDVSVISVGKNNKFGHPKKEVLDTLESSFIYRTDIDGSIEIKINKNGYEIKTCSP